MTTERQMQKLVQADLANMREIAKHVRALARAMSKREDTAHALIRACPASLSHLFSTGRLERLLTAELQRHGVLRGDSRSVDVPAIIIDAEQAGASAIDWARRTANEKSAA